MSHAFIVSLVEFERAPFYINLLSQYPPFPKLPLPKLPLIRSVRKTSIHWSPTRTKDPFRELAEACSIMISSLLPYI